MSGPCGDMDHADSILELGLTKLLLGNIEKVVTQTEKAGIT